MKKINRKLKEILKTKQILTHLKQIEKKRDIQYLLISLLYYIIHDKSKLYKILVFLLHYNFQLLHIFSNHKQ